MKCERYTNNSMQCQREATHMITFGKWAYHVCIDCLKICKTIKVGIPYKINKLEVK